MCEDCKLCKFHSVSPSMEESYEYYGYEWETITCIHPDVKSKEVESYTEPEEAVLPPVWCPLLEENKKKMPEVTRQRKTVFELTKVLQGIEPITKWEDIEIGEIYHVPPVGNERRCDWFVEDRNYYTLRVKVISDLDSGVGYYRTIFKNSDECWKTIAAHKLRDLTDIKAKLKANASASTSRTYYPTKY